MDKLKFHLRQFLDGGGTSLRIMGAALIVRAILAYQLYEVPLTGDSLYYYQVAEDLAAGETFSTYWPPGLPMYEAAVIKIFGAGHFIARVSMLLWFFLLCRLVFNLLKRVHSRVAGNIGLLILAFYPAFVWQSLEPLTQLPTATLLMALFFGTYRYLNGGRKWLWYIGLALGLITMFRPSSAMFFLLVPTVIFLQGRKLIAAMLVTLIGLAIVGPWIWFASSSKGHFIPVNTANSRNLYLGNNAWTPHYKTWYYGSHWTKAPINPEGFRQQLDSLEQIPRTDRSSAFLKTTFSHIGQRPDLFALRTLNRARVFFSFDSMTGSRLMKPPNSRKGMGYFALGGDALFFIGIGIAWLAFMFGAGRHEVERRYLRLSYAFIVLYTLPYLISFSHPSFHMPVMPLLIFSAAMFLAKGLQNRTLTWRPNWKWVVAVAVFLIIQVEWVLQMSL